MIGPWIKVIGHGQADDQIEHQHLRELKWTGKGEFKSDTLPHSLECLQS